MLLPVHNCFLPRQASEQSERVTVPRIASPVPLRELLENWAPTAAHTPLLVCEERSTAALPLLQALSKLAQSRTATSDTATATDHGYHLALLVGPEGGFSPAEKLLLKQSDVVTPVSLGTTILRAETAAMYALSCCCAFHSAASADVDEPHVP